MMGCVSSKLLRKNLEQDTLFNSGDYPSHVVSLTSTTYGALKLDHHHRNHHKMDQNHKQKLQEEAAGERLVVAGAKRSPPREEPEIINAWELMSDLEDEVPFPIRPKKSPKPTHLPNGYLDSEVGSPLKKLNQMGVKKFGGKENKAGHFNGGESVDGIRSRKSDCTPKRAFKSLNQLDNPRKTGSGLRNLKKLTPLDTKGRERSSSFDSGSSKRSLSPLFDPEMIKLFEEELQSQQGEQIKKIVSLTPKTKSPNFSLNSQSKILGNFVEKCPPGGENSVVIYTTTLRGIRKTFEDCHKVRSIIESYCIQMSERDVSMDSGFKEELRKLMGTREVKVPVVFVKGRMIGGAEEMVKMEEEGKLGFLFEGIARREVSVCEGCGGIRFVMCMECSGSCKVLGEDGKNMVRCGECNENGLIHCPLCC